MKAVIFSILISIMMFTACRQKKEADKLFNLDFEKIEEGFPAGWESIGSSNYLIFIDSTVVKQGKYSVVIEFNGDSTDFKVLSFTLPDNYDGKQITLSGYMKTENVTDGYAGLWMRIDPSVAFDNMHQRGVTGTTDWTKYEITLTLAPPITEQIVFGGLFNGKGKMWLDDLKITIDGTDIQFLKSYKPKSFLADKDNEFDKGSNIVFPELNEQQIANLELLGKIWGFLKYHHPEVGKGNYNWDYELFRILPAYLKANDNNKRDQVLLNWIAKYGTVSTCKTCKATPKDAFLKPDLLWIEKSNMNQTLKDLLRKIYWNRHQGYHYYIHTTAVEGNPVFTNENSYSNMPYPDAGFRLLALYRYWNMVQYFYPNKYLTDKNWEDVLKEYIPSFVLTTNELEYELAALQIISEINDTHAGLWEGGDKIDSMTGYWVSPVELRFIENKWVVVDYCDTALKESAGLKIGDIITHINGNSIDCIVDSLKRYYPASNQAARLRDIANNLLRSKHQTIGINYISSDNKWRQKELSLISLETYWSNRNKKSTDKCYRLLDDNIGYITLKSIKEEDISAIKEMFKDTKGIIIDIRNYPSTFVALQLGSYFVSSPTPFVKSTKGNANNPGEFTFTSALKIPKSEKTYQGKLVVIVNEVTQSQAEYTAMAFHAGDNTTIIGSTTAGANGRVSEIILPGGLMTWISGIGIYYPDGRETQRVGIVPDIEVKPTIKGIREGLDELVEKAQKVILQD
jgi:C-terminal processing protease CtpA/Prc